jgi:hypothetical protein
MPMYTYLHLQKALTREYKNKILQNLASSKTSIPSLRHMRPRSNFRDKVLILYFSVKWYPISEIFTYGISTKYLSFWNCEHCRWIKKDRASHFPVTVNYWTATKSRCHQKTNVMSEAQFCKYFQIANFESPPTLHIYINTCKLFNDSSKLARLDVLRAMLLKNRGFWDVKLCRWWCSSRRCERKFMVKQSKTLCEDKCSTIFQNFGTPAQLQFGTKHVCKAIFHTAEAQNTLPLWFIVIVMEIIRCNHRWLFLIPLSPNLPYVEIVGTPSSQFLYSIAWFLQCNN